MPESLLEVRNLVKFFPTSGGNSVKAINGISFNIQRGEALALVGESGSGKTTVGRCLLRLLDPTEGTIVFQGKDIQSIKPKMFRSMRDKIQMVFQEPYDSLNPRMPIGQIVEEPLLLVGNVGAAERNDRLLKILSMVQLDHSVSKLFPHQLSAGEQQRVGIARALITEPELVVLDEPTSALDVSVRAEILNLLGELQRRLNLSYLLISHDLTAVRRVCNRIAVMYLGKIVEIGDTEPIFKEPLHPYSKALLSSVLYPDPKETPSRFYLSGEIPSPIDLPQGCHLRQRCPWAISDCEESYPELRELALNRYVSCIRAESDRQLQ